MNSLNVRVRDVHVAKDVLTVYLDDGRSVTAPLAWYPTLLHASDRERRTWRKCGAATGIHWPLLDYHLSGQGLLDGLPEASGLRERAPVLQEA